MYKLSILSELWSIKFLVFLLLLQFLQGRSEAVFTDGGCYNISIASPILKYINGWINPSNETLESTIYCKENCKKLAYSFAAVQQATHCLCAKSLDGMPEEVSPAMCPLMCSNMETCGGEMAVTIFNITSLTAPKLTLVITDAEETDILTPLVIEVTLVSEIDTDKWLVDWGDGSVHEDQVVSHTYLYPGKFKLTVYVLNQISVYQSKIITVHEKPELKVNCSLVTEISKPIDCDVLLTSQGLDQTLMYSLTGGQIAKNFSGIMPGENRFYLGKNVVAEGLNTTASYSTKMIILPSRVSYESYITNVRGKAANTGQINIYLVERTCATGTYCAATSNCLNSCPLLEAPITCSATAPMCPGKIICKDTSSCVNSVPTDNLLTFKYILTVEVTELDINFTPEIPIWVPENSQIAFGCGSECTASYAGLYLEPYFGIEDPQRLIIYDTSDHTSEELERRLSLTLIFRQDPIIDVQPDIMCETTTPVPLADVPKPFTADTEQFINQSILNIFYSVVSNGAGNVDHEAIPILCQEFILEPTFEPEIWMAADKSYKLLVTFSQGSPIFTTTVIDATLFYDYYDDAKASSGYSMSLDLTYSTSGVKHLSLNSTNMLSQINYTSIIHVVPPVTDNWILTFLCPCYNIDDGLVYKFTLSDYQFAVWNATVEAYLTNDITSELILDQLLDFKTVDQPTFAAPIEYTYIKTVIKNGIYNLTINLSNEVSNTTFSGTVNIEEGIRVVTGKLMWNSLGEYMDGMGPLMNLYLTNFTTLMMLKSESGTPLKWKVYIMELDLTLESTSPNITHVFEEPGFYHLIFSGYNTVQQWVSSDPFKIQLVAKLEGLSVSDDGIIAKPGTLKKFLISFIVWTPVSCIMIDSGDGTPVETYGYLERCIMKGFPSSSYKGTVFPPMEVGHIFNDEAIYDIRVLAFDSNNEFNERLRLVIADIPCTMPEVSVVDSVKFRDYAPSQWRSLKIRKETNTKYQCNKTVLVERWWSVAKIDNETGISILDIEIKDIIPSWNFSQLSIPANWLTYGMYKFTFNFRIYASPIFNLDRSDYTLLTIKKSPLAAIMIEGAASSITRGFGQMLDLNPQKYSFDPDYPADSASLNFTWWCRQESPEYGYLPKDSTGQYKMLNNHILPEPLQAKVVKPGGCFGQGPGTLTTTSGKLFLNTAIFENPSSLYEIILKVAKDTRFAYVTLNLELMINPPPSVLIKCDPSLCYQSSVGLIVNPAKRVALQGSCTADCSTIMIYKWSITTHLRGSVSKNAACEFYAPSHPDYGNCDKAILTPTTQTNVAISPVFFDINLNVDKFIFKLSITTEDEDTGYTEILLIRNKPPVNGYCSILKYNGSALIETFPVLCGGWTDPEDIGINFYSYYYFTYQNGRKSKTVFASTSQSEIDLILPVGQFELYVDAVDMLDGVATIYVGNVTAYLPSQEELAKFDYSSKITYMSSIGDQTSLAMLLGAVSSIRDNAEWFNLDENVLLNMTVEEREGRVISVAQLNNEQLKVVSETMDFATLSQLEVGANVVQRSLAGIYLDKAGSQTVDMETRTNALNIIETMSKQLSKVSIASPFEMQNFMSKTLDACAALITGINNILISGEDPPTDTVQAVNWDYSADLGELEGNYDLEIPRDPKVQIQQNVLQITREKSKNQIAKIMEIVSRIKNEAHKKCIPGEVVIAHTENGATLLVGKFSEPMLYDGYYFDLTENMGASVQTPKKFCPSIYRNVLTNCKNDIDVSIIVWPTISHFYPKSSAQLSIYSRVIDFEMAMENTILVIQNMPDPILINIPRADKELKPLSFVNATDYVNSHFPVVYHQFNITSLNSGYTILLTPVTEIPDKIVFLIGHEKMPTAAKYLLRIMFKDFVLNNNETYSYFVNNAVNNNKTGRFFIAVGALTSITELLPDTKLTNTDFNKNFDFDYYLKVYISGCYFFNSFADTWNSEGMNLLKVTPNLISCSSNHLTSFGSGFQPVINDIDFEFIFANAGFLDHSSIYICIAVFLAIYIIMMIWAHIMDRKDFRRRGAIPLPDNKPEDKYLYEVTFQTGPDQEASCDSNIMFIASGDYSETEVRFLPPATDNLYRRFHSNTFVMATPSPLGSINFFRAFHDNSGEPPLDSWQLQHVIFRDLQTNEKFIFDTNAWFAFNRDEGKVDKIFPTMGESDKKTFSKDLYLRTNKVMNQDQMYLAMFLRPVGSRFGRKERVTVCAVFLYASMLFNALWYNISADSPRNGFIDFGPFTFSLEQTMVGFYVLLAVYPIVIILSTIFKRARPKNLKRCRALDAIEQQRRKQLLANGENDVESKSEIVVDDQKEAKQKEISPIKCIPWWTRILAWMFSLFLIALSLFIVWSYGIMWGEIKTVKWLSSFLMTFLISLLITQWIKVGILACCSSICSKTDLTIEDIDCDEELPALKLDEKWSNVEYVDPSIRKKVHKIEGVDIENPKIAEIRARLMKQREMSFVIKHIILYCFFLATLYIMIDGRTDYNSFLLQNHLKNSFIKEGHLKFDFSIKIENANDWWTWATSVILYELRAQRKYNNAPPYGLKGFLNDQSNRIMGYAIIRQIRSKRHNCVVTEPLNQLIGHCSGQRGLSNEDTIDFCAGWMHNESVPGACSWDEFKYKTSDELKTFTSSGRLGYYGGGGYIIKLSGSQTSLINRLHELQKFHWLDQNTKAVILEFSVYNANVNFFSICTIMAEFTDGGGLLPMWRFEPIRLIKASDWSGQLTTICEIIFVIATAVFTIKELWQIKNQKLNYFYEYWNLAEISLLLVSYVAIALYCYREFLTTEALQLFNITYGNGYVRMDSAAYVDAYWMYCIAFICFFSTIKLIKLLQFNKRMNVLALTIGDCWDELRVFLIAFAIVFIAFSCLFFFIFSADLEEFALILSALQTSFKMMMGKFDFQAMNQANSLSPLLFFFFSVINSMILINIMLTIILQAFNKIKLSLVTQENQYDLIDHVWSSFRIALRMDRDAQIDVIPVLSEKKIPSDDQPTTKDNLEDLPDKVSHLIKYINETYFEGRLDLTDAATKKLLCNETEPKFLFPPSTDDKDGSCRKVIMSDT